MKTLAILGLTFGPEPKVLHIPNGTNHPAVCDNAEVLYLVTVTDTEDKDEDRRRLHAHADPIEETVRSDVDITVNIPVTRNAHQPQFPETPFSRTSPATRLGVSDEKVVATIEIPNSHHGIFRPERKNSFKLELDFLEKYNPMTRTRIK